MFTPLVKASKKIDLNKGVFEIVQWALLNQNILKVEYKPRKSNRSFPFRIEGIEMTERMTERFEIPEDFSTPEFLKIPFAIFHEKPISAKVVFDKELSDYIQRQNWPPSQKIKELKEGRIILSLIQPAVRKG